MTYDPHKNTTEVRQGNERKTNLRALIFGLIGVVVLFAIIFAIYSVAMPEA